MNFKISNLFLLPISLMIFSCSDQDISSPEKEPISSVEELVEHSKEFIPQIYSSDNGIHMAVGYGIANSIMVEGEGGNIIIDAADSIYEAEKIYSELGSLPKFITMN